MVLSAALVQNSPVQSSLSPDFAFFSPPSVPERLRIQVSRIAMDDYESLNYDKDKLRAACKLPAFPRHHCMMGWLLAAIATTSLMENMQNSSHLNILEFHHD